jgi:8-oxo-dGTP pyrophosphatase MutT (NUDIX family)
METTMMNLNDVNAVATIVYNMRRNKILMLLRGDNAPWMPNKWDLPGGERQRGESVQCTASREMAEETGIECLMWPVGITTIDLGEDGIVHFMAATILDGEIEISKEHKFGAWVTVREAVKMDCVPGVVTAITRMFFGI